MNTTEAFSLMRFFGGLSRMGENNEALPEEENGLGTLFEENNENNRAGNEVEETVAVSVPVNASTKNALPVPASTATTALPANALSKKGKTKKARTKEEQNKINKRTAASKLTKEGEAYKKKQANKAAEREEKERQLQERYGKLLHGVLIKGKPVLAPTPEQRKANPAVELATPLEVKRIRDILLSYNENSGLTAIDAVAEYKKKYPKKETINKDERELRKTIRARMRKVGIKPSMARLTAYKTNKNRLNALNINYAKNNTEALRNTKKKARTNLFTFLKDFESPELKGRRLVKAKAKADLEEYKAVAEEELKGLRTKAQVDKGTGVNPAFITHLAMLRQAKYRIRPEDFKELSTLVKKEEFAKLKDHAAMKSLLEQATKKDACDRCILNTIFLVRVE